MRRNQLFVDPLEYRDIVERIDNYFVNGDAIDDIHGLMSNVDGMMKSLDNIEKIIKKIPDDKYTSMLERSSTMIRMQITDIIDVIDNISKIRSK